MENLAEQSELASQKRKYEEEHAQQIYLPAGLLHHNHDHHQLETTEEVVAENVLEQMGQDLVQQGENGSSQGGPLEFKSIHMVVRLADITPHDAFEMLLDSERHAQVTGQEAKISREAPHGEFSAYNGHISGINVELQKDRRIVQKWRMKDWPEGHFSLVTIVFRKVANGTKVTLTQSGVPSDKFNFIWEGWYNFYWNKMGRIDEKELKKNKRQKMDGRDNGIQDDLAGATPILHVEIPCKDMQRVMKFYGEVFGWTFKSWAGYYTLFNTKGKQGAVTGGFWLNDKEEIPKDRFISLYIHVDDISYYLERIKENGGEIVQDKTLALEEVGYYAFFRDTEGNQLGLNSKL